MIKKIMILGLCFLLVSTVFGCEADEPEEDELNEDGIIDDEDGNIDDEDDVTEHEYTDEGIIEPEYAEGLIKERSDEVINAIKDKDGEKLSEYVHPEKGVRFTPYTNVSTENDIVLTKDEVANFFEDEETYTWGNYTGSGEEIVLTPREYYDEFIYSQDFLNVEEIGYNEVLSSGSVVENQFDVYEDPIVVEYYYPGADDDAEGMDWQSLRLVFEELDGEWYLVGVINNRWTA